MRQDARSLLERLGRTEFRYQEFADPFADMELWPIFEALLTDDAVVGHQDSPLRTTEIQFRSSKRVEAESPLPPHYDAMGEPDKAVDSTSPDLNLRQFFGRFAGGQ